MDLTKAQVKALEKIKAAERGNGKQLGISGATIQNLYFKGYVKSCNWSRVWSEIDMTISKYGLEALEKVTQA